MTKSQLVIRDEALTKFIMKNKHKRYMSTQDLFKEADFVKHMMKINEQL